jgi:uncharacterized protein DUF6889
MPNYHALLARPVEAGMWKLHETFDGTYIIDDLFDINEILDVALENRARQEEWKSHIRGR